MPSREEVSYFGAGPAPLPTAVLEEATHVLLNYNNCGIGIAEISHRSSDAAKVIEDAKTALAELYDIPTDEYEILFMHGGGSGEFSQVVYHMVAVWVQRMKEQLDKEMGGKSEEEKFAALKKTVEESLKCDYLVTGGWSDKAAGEAKRLIGKQYVNVALDTRTASSDGKKFGKLPAESEWKLSSTKAASLGGKAVQPAFTYYCDNETVDGVEFSSFPKSFEAKSPEEDRLIVADMSSNFLSRSVDVRKYAVIFGGAQKNIGTTGITIVILRKSLLPPQQAIASPDLLRSLNLSVGPVVFDYPTLVKNNSLYNTLPIFDIWVAGRVMQRTLKLYGDKKLAGQEEESNKKARMIYETCDSNSDTYQVVPDKAARSRMNICLRVKGGDADAEKAFISGAEKLNMIGVKGHRSVGGIRISNYNAVTMKSVEKLVQYMKDFASGNSGATTNGTA